MNLKIKFNEWLLNTPAEEAAKVLGLDARLLGQLKKAPPKALEAIFKFYDDVFYPEVMRSFTDKLLVTKEEPKVEVVSKPEPITELELVDDERTEEEKFTEWLKQSSSQLSEATLDAMRDIFFNWQGQKIAILFPCYKTTNPVTAAVLAGVALDIGKHKARFHYEMGDAMVCNTRNKLAAQFLDETECEWSLWLDDDIIPPFGRSKFVREKASLGTDFSEEALRRHFVDRLLSHNRKIVGGCYWSRQYQGVPMFGEGTREDGYTAAKEIHNSVRPTQWVATGCLLVHRSVYEDIKEKFPDLAPGVRSVKTTNERGEIQEIQYNRENWAFFSQEEGRGEDVTFCIRARAAGHQPYVDTGLPCLHVGNNAWGPHNTMDRRRKF
jgi:hypothetical protein